MPVVANGRNYPRFPVFSEVSCEPKGPTIVLSCKKLRTSCTKGTISAKVNRDYWQAVALENKRVKSCRRRFRRGRRFSFRSLL